ncbi:MAG: hypothetical protein ACRDJL_02045, partial [Actinomycetota bacterium]
MEGSARVRRAVHLRIIIVVGLVAASLTQTLSAPAGAKRVPTTLMRSVNFEGARGRVGLALRPTHIGFKWEGSHGSRVSYRTIDETGRASPWRVAALDHDMEMG